MIGIPHLSGTIAVTSTSTIIPGHASCTMLRSVWAGGGVAPRVGVQLTIHDEGNADRMISAASLLFRVAD